MRTFAWLALYTLSSCGSEGEISLAHSGLPARLIYQGEGFRLELHNEAYTWNSERSARSLSAEVHLLIDEDLPNERRPTMLYGRLFLDVDISGEWSGVDGGTAGILDDSLREARAVVPLELNKVVLGPFTRTGVRPVDPPAWRGAVKLSSGSEVGASVLAEAIE
ncbi:MAG: hypothetical protein MK209_00240 [Planctomycetes bacterium]|nr:hypothetical protein [Planctomycetota bacterium]